MQEDMETPKVSAGSEQRRMQLGIMLKALSKTNKHAGLSKLGKSNTLKPTGASLPKKTDATKQQDCPKRERCLRRWKKCEPTPFLDL